MESSNHSVINSWLQRQVGFLDFWSWYTLNWMRHVVCKDGIWSRVFCSCWLILPEKNAYNFHLWKFVCYKFGNIFVEKLVDRAMLLLDSQPTKWTNQPTNPSHEERRNGDGSWPPKEVSRYHCLGTRFSDQRAECQRRKGTLIVVAGRLFGMRGGSYAGYTYSYIW